MRRALFSLVFRSCALLAGALVFSPGALLAQPSVGLPGAAGSNGPGGPGFGQPFASEPAGKPFVIETPRRCGTAPGARSDSALAEKVAVLQRFIDEGRSGAWTAAASAAEYACAVGDREALEAVLARCIAQCPDEADRYLARIAYARALEGFGDLRGAEAKYLEAMDSRSDPEATVTAAVNYASLLDRSGRAREALDVLSRYPPGSRAAASLVPLELGLMRELGIDPPPEIAVPARRGFAPTETPLSAVPVEDDPLAQPAFGSRIEVLGDVWIEPRSSAAGDAPGHFYYRRAFMPNQAAFVRSLALKSGDTLLVVAELGATGCRIAVGDTRYDVEDCPWRPGSARAEESTLFMVVEERVPLPPPVVVRPRSPLEPPPAAPGER